MVPHAAVETREQLPRVVGDDGLIDRFAGKLADRVERVPSCDHRHLGERAIVIPQDRCPAYPRMPRTSGSTAWKK